MTILNCMLNIILKNKKYQLKTLIIYSKIRQYTVFSIGDYVYLCHKLCQKLLKGGQIPFSIPLCFS